MPIPGTTRVTRIEENAAADAVELTLAQVTRLTAIAPAAGARYEDMSHIDR